MARLGPWNPELYSGKPWHARPFMRGETDDLPFDRDSIVLYSSYTEAIFWEESETPDNVTNTKSVLESKILNPTNTDYGDEAIASEKNVTENAKAIWLGIFPTAKLHALWKQEEEAGKNIDHGAVLELHIPTKPLQCLIDAPPQSGESGVLVKNSKDFFEKIGFGSREQAVQNLRQRLRKVAKVDSNFVGQASVKRGLSSQGGFQQAELVQFATPYQAHLNNVTRVWTPSFTKGHSWIPIEKYLENIQSQNTKTPTFSIEKELKEEYEEHEKLRKAGENLRRSVLKNQPQGTTTSNAPEGLFSLAESLTYSEEYGKKLSRQEVENPEIDSKPSLFDMYLEGYVQPYVKAQYQIEEVLEEMAEEFSFFQKLKGVHNFSFGREIRSCYELLKYRQEVERGSKAFYNSILEVDEREKEKLKKKNWGDGEEVRKFEIESNQGLLNIASKLPDLRPLESNLEKNLKEWKRIELKSARGELGGQNNSGSVLGKIFG